jgi:hypothetical protein
LCRNGLYSIYALNQYPSRRQEMIEIIQTRNHVGLVQIKVDSGQSVFHPFPDHCSARFPWFVARALQDNYFVLLVCPIQRLERGVYKKFGSLGGETYVASKLFTLNILILNMLTHSGESKRGNSFVEPGTGELR